jgi:CRISPR-associated protein Cas1
MKKLLNTLFILNENSYLTLERENIVVSVKDETSHRFPLHIFESIFCFSYAGASPALIGKCCKIGVEISFFSTRGEFLFSTVGKESGNVLLRRMQYRLADDEKQCTKLSQNIVGAKLYNSRWILERCIRDHSNDVDVKSLKKVSLNLKDNILIAKTCQNQEELLGCEGNCARQYFGVFPELLLNKAFSFNGRNRRPPKDEVNALLSFGYVMLSLDCANGLRGVGLDSFVGFYHVDKPGRRSLALDLLEELRAPVVDRFVLMLINKNYINLKDFDRETDGAVLLSESGRKKFFQYWQERKKTVIIHPYLKEKVAWGLVPYIQALLFARYIRGDLDDYPVFLWK